MEKDIAPKNVATSSFQAPPNTKSIADIASQYKVTHRTLRFYEDKGFLSPIRVGGYYRYYKPSDEVRLQVVLKGKKLGFTLKEIQDLVFSSESKRGHAEITDPALPLSKSQIREKISLLETERMRITAALHELHQAHAAVDVDDVSDSSKKAGR